MKKIKRIMILLLIVILVSIAISGILIFNVNQIKEEQTTQEGSEYEFSLEEINSQTIKQLKEDIYIVEVIISNEASQEQIQKMKEELVNIQYVKDAQYVSVDEMYELLKKEYGEMIALLEEMIDPKELISQIYWVELETIKIKEIEKVQEQIRNIENVYDINSNIETYKQVSNLYYKRIFRNVAICVAITFFIVEGILLLVYYIKIRKEKNSKKNNEK